MRAIIVEFAGADDAAMGHRRGPRPRAERRPSVPVGARRRASSRARTRRDPVDAPDPDERRAGLSRRRASSTPRLVAQAQPSIGQFEEVEEVVDLVGGRQPAVLARRRRRSSRRSRRSAHGLAAQDLGGGRDDRHRTGSTGRPPRSAGRGRSSDLARELDRLASMSGSVQRSRTVPSTSSRETSVAQADARTARSRRGRRRSRRHRPRRIAEVVVGDGPVLVADEPVRGDDVAGRTRPATLASRATVWSVPVRSSVNSRRASSRSLT